jgi:hypothetical protein
MRNIYRWKGMYMKNGWTPLEVHNNNNNNRHKEAYKLLDWRQKEWKHSFL